MVRAHATASDARANAATALSPSPCSTGMDTAVAPHVVGDRPAELDQRLRGRVRRLLERSRRPFDVKEQERDRSDRQYEVSASHRLHPPLNGAAKPALRAFSQFARSLCHGRRVRPEPSLNISQMADIGRSTRGTFNG